MLWVCAIVLLFAALYVFLIMPAVPGRDLGIYKNYHYAHRGLWRDGVPENSTAAFREAVTRGFGIETDVQLTSDGRLVLFHDDTLERMCGDPRRISDLTLAEIRAFHLSDTKEKIPELDSLLEITDGQVPLLIEIKTCSRIRLLCETLNDRLLTYSGPYCVESFDPRAVQWYKKHRPDVIRGQLAFGLVGGGSQKKSPRNRLIASLVQNALGRPDFIAFEHLSDRSLPVRLVRRLFHPAMAAWTVRSQSDMNALRQRYQMQIFDGFVPDEKA